MRWNIWTSPNSPKKTLQIPKTTAERQQGDASRPKQQTTQKPKEGKEDTRKSEEEGSSSDEQETDEESGVMTFKPEVEYRGSGAVLMGVWGDLTSPKLCLCV